VAKKLLILGGNQYNVPSIRAARRAGFFTLVADRNSKAPGLDEADIGLPIDLFDYEALLKAIETYGGVDGIISMAEVGVRPAAFLSARLGLPSITQEAAAQATSKAAMRRLWANIPQYSIDFEVVKTEEEAIRAVDRLGTYPLIFKPDRSFGGARGVSCIESKSEIHEAFQFAKSGALSNSDIVVERFVYGSEHSAEVLIWERKTSALCIGQKVKSKYPYRVDVSVQYPAPLSPNQEAVIADMCQKAITDLRLTQGIAHVEFVYTQEGPILFELGARCGGGHTPQIAQHVSGVDEFIEACRMACGMPPTQLSPFAKRGSDYRFLVFPPGKMREVIIPDRVKSHKNILDVEVTLLSGEDVRPLRSTAERTGFVVAVAEDRQAAIEWADWACSQIVVEYDDGSVAHPYPLSHYKDDAP
jgi:biotin carboxylase